LRVFRTKWFVKFASREGIGDAALLEAIIRLERGLVDSDLGGGIIKQRIARPGRGKSGGLRALIAVKAGKHAVFVFGFAKSGQDNIGNADLARLKSAAKIMLAYDDADLDLAVNQRKLTEVGR